MPGRGNNRRASGKVAEAKQNMLSSITKAQMMRYLAGKHRIDLEAQGSTSLLRTAVATILNSAEPGIDAATVTKWLEKEHEESDARD